MITDPLTAISVMAVVAIACQWVASRLDLPSVLLLLLAGVGLSPVVDPDAVFGDLLFTAVGLGVAVLLFEGGTSLHWRELSIGRGPVIRLVTLGALVAWAVGSFAASVALEVDTGIAVLIGAVLVVSGPTVVVPLLRVVRPREPVGSILRWEGIVIDPIGAAVAIVVLDAIVEDRSIWRVFLGILTTFGAGVAIGVAASAAVITVLRHRLVVDRLQVPLTTAAIIGAYGAANAVRPEAGLIAATLLGMAFANQRRAAAYHIAEFNEHLGTSILGMLFIVLGARVELSQVWEHLPASLVIVALLVIVARPLTVLVSTLGTDLVWRERGFLMTLAPRGVVAAAVASLFALELEHEGIDPGPMVPVVFSVVMITVAIAGTTAAFAARKLRIARPTPNGVALIGGSGFAIDLAAAFTELSVPTIHIGLDERDAEEAARAGQLVYSDRLDTDQFPATMRAVGVHAALALSTTDHLNGFATKRLSGVVDKAKLYGLFEPVREEAPGTAPAVRPKLLLPEHITATDLQDLHQRGTRIRIAKGVRHPRSGWLTLCRIDRDRNVIFDPDPTNAAETDNLIQIGPRLSPDQVE